MISVKVLEVIQISAASFDLSRKSKSGGWGKDFVPTLQRGLLIFVHAIGCFTALIFMWKTTQKDYTIQQNGKRVFMRTLLHIHVVFDLLSFLWQKMS